MAFGTPTAGAVSSGVTAGETINVALPTSASGDTLVLAVLSLPFVSVGETGWTVLRTGPEYTYLWKRRGGTQGAIPVNLQDVFDGEGTGYAARCFAFSGCIASGSPVQIDAAPVARSAANATGTSIANDSASLLAAIVASFPKTLTGASGGANAFISGQPVQLVYNLSPSASAAAPVGTWASGSAAGEVYTFALLPAGGATGQSAAIPTATGAGASGGATATAGAAGCTASVPAAVAAGSAPAPAAWCPSPARTAAVPAATAAGSVPGSLATTAVVRAAKYTDDFNAYAAGSVLPGPWAGGPVGATGSLKARAGGAGGTAGVLSASYYNAPIANGQFVEADILQSGAWLLLRAGPNATAYRAIFTFDPEAGTCSVNVAGLINFAATSLGGVEVPAGYGSRWRFEVAGDTSPTLSIYLGGMLVWSVTDAGNVGPVSGFPALVAAPNTSASFDNAEMGEVPSPASASFPAATATGTTGAPAAWSGDARVPTATASGSAGSAYAWFPSGPRAAVVPAAVASGSAGAASAKVSRIKQGTVFPAFSAFGGLDSYTGNAKGQIAADGEESIGYRLGIGNDGTAGDRVFLSVPAADLVRADAPSDPVGKATLHVTFLTMMSWDYLAAGAAANPSGVAFKVRKVTAGSGMTATLVGDYGTITARPTWLSGQTWYDGTVRGSPVWTAEVDVTALYNESAQAGTDLAFCLECQFTNPKWVAEIVGVDSALAWARPRLEVHRWGAVGIDLADTDTPTPTITVDPGAGTITEIRWGYDEQVTPPGGVLKWTAPAAHAGEVIEGRATASPVLLPMLESSTRVHVEVEIDYGAQGALLFKRSFKTPQTPKPRIEVRPGVYAATDCPAGTAYGTGSAIPKTAIGWTDVRGPVPGPAARHGDLWFMFAKGDTSAISGLSGSAWHLHVIQGYQEDWVARLSVGTATKNVPYIGSPWPVPYPTQSFQWDPTAQPTTSPGPNMHFVADDISHPLYDPTTCDVHFLASTLNGGTGKYDVRLWNLSCWTEGSGAGDSGAGPGLQIWPVPLSLTSSAVLYSATVAPDLKRTGAVTRTCDWRNSLAEDLYPPLLAAFVADGQLRVYRHEIDYNSSTPNYRVNGVALALDTSAAVTGITSVRFLHHLSLAGVHHTILAATGSGNAWISSRADDDITFTNGGGHTRTTGTWTAAITPAAARVWVTEILPSDSNGHVHDTGTSHIAVQLQDGTVGFYNWFLDNAQGGTVALAPAADFGTTSTWNWANRVVGRWPALAGYSTYATTPHGGMVTFKASGSTLTAQRVQDFCRVSDETTVDVGATVNEVLVSPDQRFYEGQRVPVVLACADGYRIALVTVGVDVPKMWMGPDENLRGLFSSGKLTTADVRYDSPNMRLPSEFVRLPGHNAFAIGWRFDPAINPFGMMNECGWNYFAFQNCEGERVRVIVHDAPAFGGKWRDKGLRQPTYDVGYQPEAIGGGEWMLMKFATWFWTNDPPTKPDRQWRRVLDGMDYVLDGESGGGAYIISIQSKGPTLWLAHDMVSDIPTWEGDVAAWLQGPNASLVKWVSAQGELLEPDGRVLSQAEVMP